MKNIFFVFVALILLVVPVYASPAISQGDRVYLNDTVDVRGVMGWGYAFAYYGNGGDVPTYIIEPKKTYAFYIDPAIFKTRVGEWYQWEGNMTSNSHSYDLAFTVVGRERNIIINNTTINMSTITVNKTPAIEPKHVSDYVVARGDTLTIKSTRTSNVWVFGTRDHIYNKRSVGGYINFNKSEINSLRPETYTMLIQYPGDNSEFNTVYDKKNGTIKTLSTYLDGWTINETEVGDMDSNAILNVLKTEILMSDDTYELFRMEVQYPYITIASRDNVDKRNSDLGVITITGYTNVREGTVLNFSVDDIKFSNMRVKPFTSTLAEATEDPGDLRYFVAHIPFYYSDMKVGEHTITGTTAIGGGSTVEFYVYSLPEGSERPSTGTKYINGSEFIPQPTPEIIKVIETQIVEKEVIKTVTVIQTITPDTGMIYANQKRANDKSLFEIVSGVAALLIGGYIISVVLRGRKE